MAKEEFPLSELIVGTECGGSDPTSGSGRQQASSASSPGRTGLSVRAAPPSSATPDRKTQIPAWPSTSWPAGPPLPRSTTASTRSCTATKAALRLVGEEIREGNPSPGNKTGGITTLEEKSLGCIHKGGHSPVNAVYDYAKQVQSKQGLVIMDTPDNDPSSVSAMVAGARRSWSSPPAAHSHRQPHRPRYQDYRQPHHLRQHGGQYHGTPPPSSTAAIWSRWATSFFSWWPTWPAASRPRRVPGLHRDGHCPRV